MYCLFKARRVYSVIDRVLAVRQTPKTPLKLAHCIDKKKATTIFGRFDVHGRAKTQKMDGRVIETRTFRTLNLEDAKRTLYH